MSGGLSYELDEDLELFVQQEAVQGGPKGVYPEMGERLTSTLGLSYRIADDLRLAAAERLRWSGDKATVVGLYSRWGEDSSVYVQERLESSRLGRGTSSATVIGAQRNFGKNGSQRAYSEYQLVGGASAPRGRAVMGMGKRWALMPWFYIDTAFEHGQSTGGPVGMDTRDALSLAMELLGWEDFKLSLRYELRYQDQEEERGGQDLRQVVALHRMMAKLTPALTLHGRLDLTETMDQGLDQIEARSLEAVAALAYRPAALDWFQLLLQYGHILERTPRSLLGGDVRETDADVLSVVPIIDTPWGIQVVEKLAYRRTRERALDLPERIGDTLLLINRLNWRVLKEVDISGEWRFRRQTLSDEFEHGLLAEMAYLIAGHVRLAVGYNFTSFGDNEFLIREHKEGGPFLRVAGQY